MGKIGRKETRPRRWEGLTTFALWAPTARNVALCAYAGPTSAATSLLPMQRDAATGNWSTRASSHLDGTYYLYLVDVFVPGTGWVRNRADASVEALIQGADAALDALTAWARRGPSGARVAGVTSTTSAAADEPPYQRFEIRPTV